MKKRRRLLPQFGLRSILALTTVVAVVCGTWLVQAQRQRDASEQLNSIGAALTMEKPAVWLRWLPAKVLEYDGGHFFCPITEASFYAHHVVRTHPPILPLLAKLPQLKVLTIGQECLGSESLAGLAACRKLESLELGSSDFDDETLSQLPRLPRLKSLDLSYNRNCTNPEIRQPQLQSLDLSGTRANNETLTQIAKLTQLQHLSLDRTRVSDEGIAALKPLKKLQSLTLDSTSTTGKSVGGIRSLKLLTLHDSQLDDHGLSEICEMPNLEHLDVRDCRAITDAAFARLAKSKTLQSLNFSDCRRVGQTAVDAISQISTLRELYLEGSGITSLAKLERLSQLKLLSFSSDEVAINELLRFADHIELKFFNQDPRSLKVGYVYNNLSKKTDISSQMLAIMAGRGNGSREFKLVLEGIAGLNAKHIVNFHREIEQVSLARSRFESDVLWLMNSWPNLKRLVLDESAITNNDLEAIGGITNLQELQLNSTAIDDEGFLHLCGLDKLTELSLDDTQVTQESLPLISSFRKLRRLELPFVPEPDCLLKLLVDCPMLEVLCCCKQLPILHGKHIESQNEEFAFAFFYNRHLNLGEMQFSAQQLQQLLNLRTFASLKSSAISDELCELLIDWPQIDSLDLAGSPITDVGLATLSSREHWTSLDLRNTNVTLAGVASICKRPNRLDSLNYDCSDDPDEFIDAIRGLKFLRHISYPFSRVAREDARKLLTYCKESGVEFFELETDHVASTSLQIDWMLGKAAFDPDSATHNLLGSLIDDAKIREFKPSAAIKYVTAIGVSCDSDALIDKLIACPNLRELTLQRVPLSIDAVGKLKNLKRLGVLQLSECGLDDSHLPRLAELTQVTNLTLDSNQIYGEQLDCFAGSKQLDLLDLRSNPLTPNARRTARQLMQQSRWTRIVR